MDLHKIPATEGKKINKSLFSSLVFLFFLAKINTLRAFFFLSLYKIAANERQVMTLFSNVLEKGAESIPFTHVGERWGYLIVAFNNS